MVYDEKLLKTSTYASIAVAGFLFLIKSIAWIATESVSMQASLVDSLVDSFASLINFFALRSALVPADEEHRFGHGKIEAIASQGQSVFIAGTAIWIIFEAINKIISPEPITNAPLGISVTIITIIITFALVIFQQYVFKKTNSTIIKADKLHFKSDLLLNLSVLFSFILQQSIDCLYIDPICGLLIGIYIIHTSWKIAKESFDILIDKELPSDKKNQIAEIIKSHPKVKGMHDFKTRSSGKDCFVQVHIELDGNISLKRAHNISNEITKKICNSFANMHVIIHQDTHNDSEEY